jgi:hypothetical protein
MSASHLQLHLIIKGLRVKSGSAAGMMVCSSEDREQIVQAIIAAGFGLVADAKAEALGEAADRFKQRSDTYHNTMQEMTASKEYGLEDIVRYGAYSAEANTTATWLRTQAAKTRATE